MTPLRLPAGLLAAALLAAAATEADAFGGFRESLPASPTAAQVGGGSVNGLQLEIDTRWTDQPGYRPVRLAVTASPAANRARTIEITVFGASGIGPTAQFSARQTLSLPEDETRVAATLLLPALRPWNVIWWETRVDGEVDPVLSAPARRSRPVRGGPVAGKTADLTVVRPLVGESSESRAGAVKQYPRLEGLSVDEAKVAPPDRWLEYSAIDVVSLDFADFETLIEGDAQGEALLAWLAAGGSLWIDRVETGVDGLNRIAELLGGESRRFSVALDAAGGDVDDAPGWRYEALDQQEDDAAERALDLANQALSGDVAGAASRLAGANSRGWYAVRDYGFGRVQAFPRTPFDVPQRLSADDRKQAIARWRAAGWSERHGFALGAQSEQFGNLLIPGVGLAPVTEFQVLITLFVIGIGPLNYWLLRRSQRLHLLVLTTPLSAAAVTLALFAYALLGDGLGVKSRVRSLTLLTQPSAGAERGVAASWSRVSRYHASTPREPMAFDGETAVYPILPVWESAIAEQGGGARGMAWDQGRQRFERGWAPTRTAVQHLVVRSGETDRRLRFSPPDDPAEVANELGAALVVLMVKNAAGAWSRAADLGDGQAGRLAGVDRLAAVAELREFVLMNEPEFPAGAGQSAGDALDRLGFGPRWRGRRRAFSTATLDENLLDQAIDRVVGLRGGGRLPLPPRSYVAVTRTAVETPLGYEDGSVTEIGSFHLVVGRW